MMRSLTARVTVGGAVVLAVFITLTTVALDRAFRDSARRALHQRLLGQVYLLMAATDVSAAGRVTVDGGMLPAGLRLPGSGLYAQVVGAAGDVLWHSPSAVSVTLAPERALAAGVHDFKALADGGRLRAFRQRYGVLWSTGVRPIPLTFVVIETATAYLEQIEAYRRSLWEWLGLSALALVLVQAVLLRWGLRPLRRVSEELTRLEEGAQERIEGHYPRELERLTGNLNSLVAHERARQRRYRDALADLAHSLKTPLAVIGAARDQETAERTRIIDEEIARMRGIVDYHLQRAATRGPATLRPPTALRPVAQRVGGAVLKAYHDKNVVLDLDIPPALGFAGDEGDLTEVLGNTIDNACKWCRNRVRVRAGARGGRLRIEIDDDGPGVPDEALGRVLERGVRADTRVPGQGIGLAVTCDVVEAYGGNIGIERSALGGARFWMEFPQSD